MTKRARTAILTGAAGGTGAAVAHAMAEAGYRLVLTDTDPHALSQLAEGMRGDVRVLPLDLREPESPARLLALADEEWSHVDALVHTAAVLRRQPIEDVSGDDWDFQHQVNLRASFFLARAVAIHMRERATPGNLVLFASQSFWTGGYGDSVVYATTKGGLVTMTRGMARTFGAAGITVNAIAPGLIRTAMLLDQSTQGDIDAVVAATPLGRIAEPDDLVGPTLFLAGPDSKFVTGTVLNVSGGWLTY
ncbi:MAG: SDR family oxidoreductase [Candidatus Nanopelagicales bacterium]|nr:SDR family oxidoreductase [Candidatus Nanopelagicales bacterium]MCF8536375.1 SDR family oxidoreductase [Candidatus Nanopelagicales bacterium]MCF8541545.1 SDR family oxidoreductase [Candidatus Nanopelagicales bacterium]